MALKKSAYRNLVVVGMVFSCVGLGLMAPRQARAEDTSLKARLNAAKKACVVGDYKAGADVLGDLYVQTNDPTLLYNQARCYEQNNQNQQAIDRFREYLRKTAASITPETRADVEQHIAECKARMREDEGTPVPAVVVPPPAPPPALAPTPEPATPVTAAPPAGLNVSESPTPAMPEESPFYKKWWFWTAVGGAVVAGTVTAILLAGGSKSACSGEKSVCLGVK